MLKYHYYFLLLKVCIAIQFLLILIQTESVNSVYYVVSDFIFKISLALFLLAFFLSSRFSTLEKADRYIVSFAGSLLLFDATTGNLPKVLAMYGLSLPSWWPVQKS